MTAVQHYLVTTLAEPRMWHADTADDAIGRHRMLVEDTPDGPDEVIESVTCLGRCPYLDSPQDYSTTDLAGVFGE